MSFLYEPGKFDQKLSDVMCREGTKCGCSHGDGGVP
jgi:hypothetical protein